MIREHSKILCQVIHMAGKSPNNRNEDAHNAIKRISSTWSDGNYITPFEAYDYLEENKPNELEKFMGVFVHMIKNLGGNSV